MSIEGQVTAVDVQYGGHGLLGLGTLNGQLRVVVALVVDLDVKVGGLLVDPSHVLVDVGGVDDQEQVVLAHFVHQQVIHGSSVGIEHHAIEHLAHLGTGDVVGEDIVDKFLGLGTSDAHLTHVRHVEHADGLAHGVVLGLDAIVLDGHVIACEWAHQRAQGHMLVVETGDFDFVCHNCDLVG